MEVKIPGGSSALPPPADPTAALRVLGKSGAARTWLRLDGSGDCTWLHLDKHGIAARCGVPLRDLRVLEPGLTTSYATTLLCRERTMVINLEHIKMLVTAEEALVPNADLPEAAAFAAALGKRLKGELSSVVRTGSAPNLSSPQGVPSAVEGLPETGSSDLPFEFKVLEAALEAVCGALELAARELEGEAHPALDALTSKVTSLNLERVKRVKVRMTRVTGRCAAVREEIQRFLDDDSDMRDMYLTRKLHASSANYHRPSSELGGASPYGGQGLLDPMDDDADIQQLEDLLETYFAQIDHAYNRMKALDEYVGSTEDYINIDLDSHRNQLIQIDLVLTFAMFITSLFTLVTGVFGMNLDSGLAEDKSAFKEVTIISTILVLLGFTAFLYVARRLRLLNLF